MFVKALFLLCVLSAVAPERTDDVIGDIFEPSESTEPSTEATVKSPESCTARDGKNGECVPYYKCRLPQTSSGIIDIHFSEESGCASYIEVCCTDIVTIEPNNTAPETENTTSKREGCGWRNPNGLTGVFPSAVSDGEAQFAEFPWMCAILKFNDTTNESSVQETTYVGSGSLIHPSAVLTVAHLASTPAHLRVRCGEWDSINDGEPYQYQERDVATVEVHPDFNKKVLYNDMALLFLAQPMELTPHVGVACLPTPQVELEKDTWCLSVGWGKDNFGKEGRYQNILKKMEVPTLKHSKCEQKLQQTRLGQRFKLHRSFTCARDSGDSCVGDGGAPLSCPISSDDGRYMVYGVTAWGVGCDAPAVHAAVSPLRVWVDEQCIKRGYDTSVYSY